MEPLIPGEFRVEGEPEDVSLLKGHRFSCVRGEHGDTRSGPDDAGRPYENCPERIRTAGGFCETRHSQRCLKAEYLHHYDIRM